MASLSHRGVTSALRQEQTTQMRSAWRMVQRRFAAMQRLVRKPGAREQRLGAIFTSLTKVLVERMQFLGGLNVDHGLGVSFL